MAPYCRVGGVVVEGPIQDLWMDGEGHYYPPFVGHWMRTLLVLKVIGKRPKCLLVVVQNMG